MISMSKLWGLQILKKEGCHAENWIKSVHCPSNLLFIKSNDQILDMKAIMDLIGRMCISLIFFYEAYDSIMYAKATKQMMTDYGLVWRQDLLFYGAVVALVLGSILVLIGYRASLGAFLLLAYWIPVTLIVHSFWNDAPELRRMESIHFMKNIAIAGGLLSVLVNGSGKISIRRLFATFRVPNA